jgi:hypothetical protein
MKPRLFFRYGLWHCSGGGLYTIRSGFTPLEAYKAWAWYAGVVLP